MYHVEYSGEKILEWIRQNIYLALAFVWVVVAVVALWIWERPFVLVTMMALYIIVTLALVITELTRNITCFRATLETMESRRGKIENLVYEALVRLENTQEDIMAIGNETRAALTELREAIVTETDQAVEKIIAATNADTETAQAIRDAVADVKNIIPDDVEETDIPTTDTPEDEPGDGSVEEPVEDDEVEVDPEALPGDDA